MPVDAIRTELTGRMVDELRPSGLHFPLPHLSRPRSIAVLWGRGSAVASYIVKRQRLRSADLVMVRCPAFSGNVANYRRHAGRRAPFNQREDNQMY